MSEECPLKAHLRDRMVACLQGMFIADALGSPLHWYYNRETIKKEFGRVEGYMAPVSPHPESFMDGSMFKPNPEWGKSVLHGKAKYYNQRRPGSASNSCCKGGGKGGDGGRSGGGGGDDGDREGRLFYCPDRHTHYHQGLQAGEGTLTVHTIRCFLRTVARDGVYDPDCYLGDWVTFMTTPGGHNDMYLEVFVRHFFLKLSYGAPLRDCAPCQRDTPCVGSLSGIVLAIPAFLFFFAEEIGPGVSPEEACARATERAIAHHELTHVSENVTEAVRGITPLIARLLTTPDADIKAAVQEAAGRIHLPAVRGEEFRRMCKDTGGPSNMCRERQRLMHLERRPEPFKITEEFLAMPDEQFVGDEVTHACYAEHGLPACLYLAFKYAGDFEEAVVCNANLGGDNTSRGAILAAIMGLQVGTEGIPPRFIEGLVDGPAIQEEVEKFVDAVLRRGLLSRPAGGGGEVGEVGVEVAP